MLPGLVSTYGDNVPMDIHFEIVGVGNVEITADNSEIGGEVNLITQWWVETPTGMDLAAQITLNNLKFGFSAIIQNMNVSLSIDQIKSTDV